MESIRPMTPEGSPFVALAQQGAEAANHVIAERSTDNPRREPPVDNRSYDRAKRARSEVASSASGNHRLADNDVHRWITQNRHLWESGCGRDDLRNVIDDVRHLRTRSPTPPRCSPTGDVTPSERGSFRALATPMRQVVWPEKFKAGHINKYDGSNNLEEFIQVYHIIIKTT
jgi:hypothetical protein